MYVRPIVDPAKEVKSASELKNVQKRPVSSLGDESEDAAVVNVQSVEELDPVTRSGSDNSLNQNYNKNKNNKKKPKKQNLKTSEIDVLV